MPKLNDTQTLLLSHAAKRDSGAFYPLPDTRNGAAARAAKAIMALSKLGLAEERETSDAAGTTRYRYYVSQALHERRSDTGLRIPARELEALVAQRTAALFDDPVELIATAWLDVPVDLYATLDARCRELAEAQRQRKPDALATITQVQVTDTGIDITCSTKAIATALGVSANSDAPATITLTERATLRCSGTATRLVQAGGVASATTPDRSLIKQLITARRWWAELRRGEIDGNQLAAREGVGGSYVTRIVRLAFPSPSVVQAMLEGKQRAGITSRALTLDMVIPADWREQERLVLGDGKPAAFDEVLAQ